MHHLFQQLLISTAMVLSTVAFHGVGLALLDRMLRQEMQDELSRHIPPMSPRVLGFTLLLVLALFALHGIEIWYYAAFYLMLNAVPDLETAVYFSTITYGGIGFSDEYMTHYWRILSAIEGINGVLLLGWSTAFFVTVFSRLGRRR